MTRSSSIRLEFGGEERTFCLRYGEVEELQRLRDAGPEVLFHRLGGASDDNPEAAQLAGLFGGGRQYQVADVSETLRLGLEGGGASATEAGRLVKRYVKDVPDWPNNVRLACLIIAAFLVGAPEDQPEKSGEEGTPEAPSPTANGDSATSTERARPSATPRRKSVK